METFTICGPLLYLWHLICPKSSCCSVFVCTLKHQSIFYFLYFICGQISVIHVFGFFSGFFFSNSLSLVFEVWVYGFLYSVQVLFLSLLWVYSCTSCYCYSWYVTVSLFLCFVYHFLIIIHSLSKYVLFLLIALITCHKLAD